MKFAVIRTGGKQYLVRKDDTIVVDNLNLEPNTEIELHTLAEGDDETNEIELGKPLLKTQVKAKVLENVKGEKIRVARYKSKVRSRKVKGFRQALTKVRIISV